MRRDEMSREDMSYRGQVGQGTPLAGASSAANPNRTRHEQAPLAQALADFADRDILRLTVPGHQAQPGRRPGLADFIGERAMALDIEPMVDGIDLVPTVDRIDLEVDHTITPRQQAMALAADAWGARRTWFLTNGASQGNLTVTLALRGLGDSVVVQRSMHSSVMDGMAMAGLEPIVVMPSVDTERGMAHGIVPADLDAALAAHPGAAAAYIVTPSYFGAVSDVTALAEVAHRHGVPLVVDEAWGSHFGFHNGLPVNALRLGADLVVSSTHKLAGSLGQSAMLHLGDGPWADTLKPLVERALRVTSSTSESALLLASLDLARRDLMTHPDWIGESIAQADEVRARLIATGRFGDPTAAMLADPSVIAVDPLRIVVDTAAAGLSGHAARRHLMDDHAVHAEMSTEAVVVLIVGAGTALDVDRIVRAFEALPAESHHDGDAPLPSLPRPGARLMSLRTAMMADSVVVPAASAIGRISVDSLAAYPPGVPNLLPGEVVTREVVAFLQATAAAPNGYVRGATDPAVRSLRVVR